MNRIASELHEYKTANEIFGVGKILAPQLMAEVGDTRRFRCRRAITTLVGSDSAPYQLGQDDIKSRHISKMALSIFGIRCFKFPLETFCFAILFFFKKVFRLFGISGFDFYMQVLF